MNESNALLLALVYLRSKSCVFNIQEHLPFLFSCLILVFLCCKPRWSTDECRPKSDPATVHGSIQVWVNHSHLNLKVFHVLSVPTTDGETERARGLVCLVCSCAMTRGAINLWTLTVYFLVLYMLILNDSIKLNFYNEVFSWNLWFLYKSHFFITM